ncbi:MAG: hypothetical protein KGY99_08000 [Phycisphaerae bacterium]|nr:hypothetical protein [Phycisphaerae bacterium]
MPRTTKRSPADAAASRSDLSRRELLRTVARGGVLAAVAAGAWALVRPWEAPSPTRCINASRCASCGALSDCALPAARRHKGEPT